MRGDVLVVVVEDGDGVVGDGVELEIQFTSFGPNVFFCFASSAALPGLPAVELPPSPFFAAAAADCLACLA